MIRYRANLKKAGTCKFLGGCNKAIKSGELCIDHQPIKAEKSDRCGSCGRVLGVEVKVRGGVLSMLHKARGNSGAQENNGGKESGPRIMLHTGQYWHQP